MLVTLELMSPDRSQVLRFIRTDTYIEIQVADTGPRISKAGSFTSYPSQLIEALESALTGYTDELIGKKEVPFGIKIHADNDSDIVFILFGQYDGLIQLSLSKFEVSLIIALFKGHFGVQD